MDPLPGGRSTHDIADLLDLHDGRFDLPLADDDAVRELLRSARRIAIVGASPRPDRPSNGVLRQLRRAGYEVVPVNPAAAEVNGLRCFPTLAAAVAETGPVDIVDVFRRAADCPEVARAAVAAGAGCLWLQLGIASREAGRIALDAGLVVVMDRCMSIEYVRLGVG